jgi:N-acetylneuraminic acid mutarotase
VATSRSIAFFGVAAALAAAIFPAAAAAPGWRSAAALPVPRTEVAAARLGSEVAVVGGFLLDGSNTGRADAYVPARNRWRRLPDLPVSVDHAAAASGPGVVYVAGGYGSDRRPLRTAFAFQRGRWRRLPTMPLARAAAGAQVIGRTLYVVGGVGPAGLARAALAFDLDRRRWRTIPGPTRREHLAVAASGGRLYALGGRTAGLDTNLALLEAYTPGARAWTRLPRVPQARGGTAATAYAGSIVSIGGEEPQGTIASVYAYDTRRRRWSRLADLPTPRHGLGAVTLGGRIYAIAGGPVPGLTVSGANEVLDLGRR